MVNRAKELRSGARRLRRGNAPTRQSEAQLFRPAP